MATVKKQTKLVKKTTRHEAIAKKLGKWVGLPLVIYLVFFVFFTWPWVAHFNSHFFTDTGDGLQNVWNMWWIDKSIVDLHQLPWFTNYLHYPHGVTLLGQTLNPFNGFVGIGLMHVFGMSLVQAFNTMIAFSFVASGITAFWLCYYFTKRYTPSLIGGFIFTFSSYHFAHAIGHMQLVSLEWMPLFILLWWKLLVKPSYRLAVGASFALLLILFCDYYYFLYSVIIAMLIFGYLLYKKELPSLRQKKNFLPLGLFIGTSMAIVAPLPLALLQLNAHEKLTGSHPSRLLSTDILTPFIDGGFWRFHVLTDWYWKHVPAFVSESSVYLGLSVIILVVIAIIRRKKFGGVTGFWIITGFIFGILSLGPRLFIAGNTIERIPLPYDLLETLFPALKLSGTPIRMMVIVTLSAAIISSIVLSKINLSKTKGKLLVSLFVVILCIEMWPSPLTLTPSTHPAYVDKLRSLPAGAVYDNATTTSPAALYDQTIHEKPILLGYISRTPQSVEDKDWQIVASFLEHKYYRLCSEFGVRYITEKARLPLKTDFPIIYKDKKTLIYDFKNSPRC